MVIKLKLKDTWNEISLATFLELAQVDEAPTNDLEKDIAKLSILAEVERNYFDSYPASEIKKFSHVLDFLETEPTAEVKPFYFIGDKKYKFISQIKDLTAGQFVDVMNIAKDKTNFNEKLHTLISIFLLPVRKATLFERLQYGKKEITEKYLETPQEQTAENILQNMMIPDVMGLSVFFCQILRGFVNSIKDYLEKKTLTQSKSVLTMLKEDKEVMMIQKVKKMIEKMETATTSLHSMDGLPQ
ncbi:MAG TPA: hypothetical protein VIH86_15050 [Puia sp.]